jgi:hypothetical protein
VIYAMTITAARDLRPGQFAAGVAVTAAARRDSNSISECRALGKFRRAKIMFRTGGLVG